MPMTHEDITKLYDRMRETEAQTREQNVQIASLSTRIDALVKRYDTLVDHLVRIIYFLVSVVGATAVGPKIVEKFMPVPDSSRSATNAVALGDIAPWRDSMDGKVCTAS